MFLKRTCAAASLFGVAIAAVSLAELVGVGGELGFPVIVFDSQGNTSYDAGTDLFTVDAKPIAARFAPNDPPRIVAPTGQPANETVSIQIIVDDSGALVGGVPGDDLIVIGEVDSDGNGSVDFDGVLLTGEITDFGFAVPGVGDPTSQSDFKFTLTGGSMAPLFAGGSIGVVLTSENSSFDGGFSVDFGGNAKGNIGFVPARCGDGTCDTNVGEDPCTCPEDCGRPVCGDGVCECEEDQSNCCQDCGCADPVCTTCNAATGACESNCGNGTCEPSCGEDCETCVEDCPTTCGDGVCECEENQENCCQDCGCADPVCMTCDAASGACDSNCGNGTCEPNCGEDCETCVEDCPTTCGDGVCECEENQDNCCQDCGCADPVCTTCNAATGACDSNCGNGTCEPNCGEDCKTCVEDCETCEEDCEECDGKVTTLTLRYNGAETAQVTIDAKRGPSTDGVFDAVLNPGDEFTIVGPPTGNPGFAGTLGTEIDIYVDGEFHTTIHTSCSVPIGPGFISGDFEVVTGASKNGGLLCPVDGGEPECGDGTLDPGEECDDGNNEDDDGCSANCTIEEDECDECDGKVTTLTLRYNGNVANAEVTIDAKRGPSTDPVFSGTVNPGGEFTIVGPPTGNPGFTGTLGTEIDILVDGVLNTTIHTSCSQPIGPGLISGDFEVLSGESKNGGLLCPLDPVVLEAALNGGTAPKPFTMSKCGALGLLPLVFVTFTLFAVRLRRYQGRNGE